MRKKRLLIIVFLLILLISLTSILGFSFFKPKNNNLLKVTPEHPFFVNGSWVKASDLAVGDLLFTKDGKKAKITKITDVRLDEPIKVYNLKVNNPENYFAGNIFVHNKAMKIPESTFYESEILFSDEVRELYREKQILDSLAERSSQGIAMNDLGTYKDVYIIDPKSVNLDELPENIRILIKGRKNPVVIKYSREGPRRDLPDAVRDFSQVEDRVADFTNEVIVSDRVNTQLNLQNLEKLFPEKRYFGANFQTIGDRTTAQAIIVEDVVEGYMVRDLKRSLFHDYYVPYSHLQTEIGDRAIDLGEKINQHIIASGTKYREIFVREGFIWRDIHEENFAISFTDRTGKQLTLTDIIDSEIDINKDVAVHLRAYEVGGVKIDEGYGHLTSLDDLLIDLPSY